jgi:hypothetical protein
MSLSEIDLRDFSVTIAPAAQTPSPWFVPFLTPISPRPPPFRVQASEVWAPNGNDRPINRV